MSEEFEMFTSYLADEIMKQRAAEAIERGERSRLVAAARKAARERRRAAKNARKPYTGPAERIPDEESAGNAEQETVMSC